MTSEIQIRPARREDQECVAKLIYGDPSPEAAGIAGGVARAVALGEGLFRAGAGTTQRDEIFLALRGDQPVGVLLARPGQSDFALSFRALLKALPVILRLYSLRELPTLARRMRLRARLQFPIPPDSYHIVEVHVARELRGTGIGSILLRHAEIVARSRRCSRVTLTTALSNPALRLYSRLGYVERASRAIAGYRQLTGSQGRVLLEKVLDRRAVEHEAAPGEPQPAPSDLY